LGTGVLLGGEHLAGVVARLAGLADADIRVRTERHALLLTFEAVLEAPPFASSGRYFEVQAARIPETLRLGQGLCVVDLLGGERHWGQLSMTGATYPDVAPACPRLSTASGGTSRP